MEMNLVLKNYNARWSFVICLLFFSVVLHRSAQAQCISTFPYLEDFEAGPSWTLAGTNSSWAWGAMSHPNISSAAGGTKCWCSGGLSGTAYAGAQQAYITSPCFDFTGILYPYISFKIFWECEYVYDGMVLQYSLNNGSTWTNVGAYGDPVNCMNANWFNYSNILNLSSISTRSGWCGRIGGTSGSCQGGNGSGGWVTARHCLSGVANQTSVTFRFLFGSGTTCNSYDGIAVDDIFIGNAPPNEANFSYACLAGANTLSFTNLSLPCPTSYTWDFGNAGSSGNTSTATNPSHVFSSSGTYSVTLTAAGPCNAPSTTVIPVTLMYLTAASSSVSCSGFSNGSSTVIPVGGTPGYSYTWHPTPASNNSPIATGLGVGIYTVNVSDSHGCATSVTTAVQQPPPMAAAVTQTNITCYGLTNGAATAIASLGVPPYSYAWLPVGAISQSVSNLAAGTYSLLIVDATGCSATHTVNITQPQTLTVSPMPSSVTCFGASNGSINAGVSGGTSPYSYTWTPGASNGPVITGLSAGTYSVAVKDVHNCAASGSVFLEQPSSSVTGSIFSFSPTCGLPNGSAGVNVSGGTPGYNYSWSLLAGTQSTATGLTGGTYSVVVSDHNNCQLTLTVAIAPSAPVALNVSTADVSCNGLSNGSATAAVTGGQPPYSYAWTAAGSGQGTPVMSNLAQGNYSIQVHDSNNCPVPAVFTIGAPAVLTIASSVVDVNCNGGNDGSFSLTASGGTPAYSFSYNAMPTAPQHGGLTAGNYTVAVKDAHNCFASSTLMIGQPTALAVAVTHTDVLCNNNTTGAVNAVASGGSSGYTYLWAPAGGNASFASALAAGVYSLILNDAHNCILVSAVTLTQPAMPVSATVVTSSVSCFAGSNGAATVTPSGGTPAYSYAWTGAQSTADNAGSLSQGNYSVQVTDAHNCSETFTFVITEPPVLTLSAAAGKFCSGLPGTLTAASNASEAPVTYYWNNTSTNTNTTTVTLAASDVYTIHATDGKGCATNNSTVQITLPPELSLDAKPTLIVCQGHPAVLTASASGGDGNYNFIWEPGPLSGPTQTIPGTSSQQYTVTVTDGCTAVKSTSVGVQYFRVPSFPISYVSPSNCAPVCITFLSDSLNTESTIQNYSWQLGDTIVSNVPSPTHCYTKTGNYNIRLSYLTKNGCMGEMQMSSQIQVLPRPVAQFTTDGMTLDAYNPKGNFINQSSGATSYSWYFNNEAVSDEENPSYTFSGVGEQTVALVVQADNGCTDVIVKQIKVEAEFTFYAPNAFSPNDDNLNDIFLPKGIGWNASQYELLVFDRWGTAIFDTKNCYEGWNGRVKGQGNVVQQDVYIYKVLITDVFRVSHEFVGRVLVDR